MERISDSKEERYRTLDDVLERELLDPEIASGYLSLAIPDATEADHGAHHRTHSRRSRFLAHRRLRNRPHQRIARRRKPTHLLAQGGVKLAAQHGAKRNAG